MKTLEDLKKVREKALEQMKIREGKFSAKVVIAMGLSLIHIFCLLDLSNTRTELSP